MAIYTCDVRFIPILYKSVQENTWNKNSNSNFNLNPRCYFGVLFDSNIDPGIIWQIHDNQRNKITDSWPIYWYYVIRIHNEDNKEPDQIN